MLRRRGLHTDRNNPSRICFVITGLDYGGAENQVYQLAMALKDRGWDVHVITMIAPVGYADELAEGGISVHSLYMRKGLPDVRGIFRLRRLLQKLMPDVVHSHMFHANLLSRVTLVLNKMSILISTAHNIYEGGKLCTMSYRLTDRLCDTTTNVSRAAVDRYVEIKASPRDRIKFVPNGLDLKRFSPNLDSRERIRRELGVEDEFIWLSVGRFEPAKDHLTLLQAFSRIQDSNTLLLLVGKGQLDKGLRDTVKTLGINDRVRFLGVRSDIPALMNGADGYVMSSVWEGMPMVLLEAGATGLCTVATDVGGNAEIVRDRETGFLVPPKDPLELSEGMVKLMLLSDKQRREMGELAREYIADNFDIRRVVDIWESLYYRLFRTHILS